MAPLVFKKKKKKTLLVITSFLSHDWIRDVKSVELMQVTKFRFFASFASIPSVQSTKLIDGHQHANLMWMWYSHNVRCTTGILVFPINQDSDYKKGNPNTAREILHTVLVYFICSVRFCSQDGIRHSSQWRQHCLEMSFNYYLFYW